MNKLQYLIELQFVYFFYKKELKLDTTALDFNLLKRSLKMIKWFSFKFKLFTGSSKESLTRIDIHSLAKNLVKVTVIFNDP